MAKRTKHIISYRLKVQLRTEMIFENKWVTKLINRLMYGGKKAIIEKIIYLIFSSLKPQTKYNTMAQFLVNKLIESKIIMELKSRRRGRRYYLIPFPVNARRQLTKALAKFIYLIRDKRKLKVGLQLRALIAFSNINHPIENKLMSSRERFYKKILQNRNFVRFRWV